MPIFFLDVMSACKQLPCPIFHLSGMAVNILKIAAPIIIVILGMIDFGKATTAGKEDDMVKARKAFINRLIAGGGVFLAVSIIQLAMGLLGDMNSRAGQAFKCASAMISGVTQAERNSGNVCQNDPTKYDQ